MEEIIEVIGNTVTDPDKIIILIVLFGGYKILDKNNTFTENRTQELEDRLKRAEQHNIKMVKTHSEMVQALNSVTDQLSKIQMVMERQVDKMEKLDEEVEDLKDNISEINRSNQKLWDKVEEDNNE